MANDWFLKEFTKKSKSLITREGNVFLKFRDGTEVPLVMWIKGVPQLMTYIECRDGNDFFVELVRIESFDSLFDVLIPLIKEHRKRYSEL